MGRKKKKLSDKRSEYIRVMLTASEKHKIETASIASGLDVGAYVRMHILALVDKSKSK